MNRHSRALAIISLVAGLALFVYVIRQAGLGEILARVRALGPGFLLILAISSSRYFSRTLAWQRCMAPEERRVGFWALWRARLAGEAIGDLTFGPIVAEPLRLLSLGGRLSLKSGVSSLAVENLSYVVSSCLMVMAGTLALLGTFALSESLRAAVLTALAAVVVAIGVVIAVVSRRWAVASALAGACARLVPYTGARGWLAEKLRHLRALEDYVFDFYARRPQDFLVVALCQVGFHLAGAIEIYATLRLMGYGLTAATAFILEAINRALNIAFIFVPALVGVDEAGTGLLTETLGLGATAGVALAIIRKIRMFCWIGLGLTFLAGGEPRRRSAQ
jgi:Lysylphosphatidylglycerol synthase TM region